MTRLYGTPQKMVRTQLRIADEAEIEPQRARVFAFWYGDDSLSGSFSDGQDRNLNTVAGAGYGQGDKIIRHKINMQLIPETVKPQKVYFGFIKLSFHDVFSKVVCGSTFEQASYHGVHTDDNSISSFIQIFPNSTANEKVGFSTSAQINPGTNGIQAVKIDDNFKHWIQLKQPVTVFDQQPLISDKWMKIPAKVKRINPYTFYGLWIFNDAVRGATPADTSVFLDLDSYQEARTI